MGDRIEGDVGNADDAAIGKGIRQRREGHNIGDLSVHVGDRPASARGYLEEIWESERHAAVIRTRIVIAQIATAISLVALVIVLATIGLSFANYVNQQFFLMDHRFQTLERRLDTIDRRIQRIATPEPEFFRDPP